MRKYYYWVVKMRPLNDITLNMLFIETFYASMKKIEQTFEI